MQRCGGRRTYRNLQKEEGLRQRGVTTRFCYVFQGAPLVPWYELQISKWGCVGVQKRCEFMLELSVEAIGPNAASPHPGRRLLRALRNQSPPQVPFPLLVLLACALDTPFCSLLFRYYSPHGAVSLYFGHTLLLVLGHLPDPILQMAFCRRHVSERHLDISCCRLSSASA